ncbi:hypothetical protein S83_025892, partial [Arachis hypogaea]
DKVRGTQLKKSPLLLSSSTASLSSSYLVDRTNGQLSLGGRMNSRIRREALEYIVGKGMRNCIWELRVNTNAFSNLCELLQVQGGLKEDDHVSLPEQ